MTVRWTIDCLKLGALLCVLFLASLGESRAESSLEVFESSYADLLTSFVDDQGRVAYGALVQDRSSLDRTQQQLADLNAVQLRSLSELDQIALYLNAYNLFTLAAVTDHYPIQASGWLASFRFPASSIRQIDGVWDELRWQLANDRLTLDEIEHEVLRKRFSEPRIHFALVCASKGCPKLRREPYRGVELGRQLDEQVRSFLADASKFRVDRDSEVVELSPIFKWFAEDFVRASGIGAISEEEAVRAFIGRYNSGPDQSFVTDEAKALRYLPYDWSLNDRE